MEKKQKADLALIFEDLSKLSVSKKLNSRLRFMVQDIIDLRKDSWKGRLQSDVNLKKLKDIKLQDNEEKRRKERRDNKQASDSLRAPPSLRTGGARDRFAAPKNSSSRSPTKSPTDVCCPRRGPSLMPVASRFFCFSCFPS